MRMLVLAVGTLLIGGAVLVPPVAAQSLLERLERRLNNLNAAPPRAEQPPLDPAGEGGLAERDPFSAESRSDQRGYLGLIADDAEEMGRGVRVLSVREGGPAAVAGLRDGDLLTAIDGQPLRRLSDMAAQLGDARADQKVRFQFLRDGQPGEVVVILGRRDPQAGGPIPANLEAELVNPPPTADASRPQLGVTVVDLTDAARQRYGLTVDRGALVSSIRSGSAADRAGMPLGAAIVSLDGQRIESPADLARAVTNRRVGERVEVVYYVGDQRVRKSLELTEVARQDPPDLPRLEAAGDAEPGLRLGRGRTDRPLLGRLEQALGGLVGPQADVPPGPVSEVDRLRQEVEALRRHVSRLEERLLQLEQRVGQN